MLSKSICDIYSEVIGQAVGLGALNNKTTERRFAVEGYCPELSNL
jgi:hypothetical protein